MHYTHAVQCPCVHMLLFTYFRNQTRKCLLSLDVWGVLGTKYNNVHLGDSLAVAKGTGFEGLCAKID